MPSPPSQRPVLGTVARSAAELATELRREFERAMIERYGQIPAQDPVLATLFHATAVQLARVYDEAEQVFPEAVFDDIVSGLGMPPRTAQPAQTVVEFAGAVGSELVTPDFPVVGINERGEHLTFSLDVPIRIGPTRLVFAGALEGGRLSVLPGAVLPGREHAGQAAPLPTGSAVLAPGAELFAPTLLLAFEPGDAHLSGFGLFVDTQSVDHPVANALTRSAWQLLDDGGVAREALVLRSRAGAGGVRLLNWQHVTGPLPDDVAAAQAAVPASTGPYGALCWVWPDVPVERRVYTRPPRAVADALVELSPPGFESAYDRPLVWVQVALPAGTRGIAADVQRVVAHAAAASNVEAYAERVNLGDLGSVVAFRPEGARTRHPLAVLSVTGEHGERYADEADLAAPIARGRYRERNGDFEVRPARGPTGRFDRYVMVRFLYTDGARANGLQPGEVAGRGGKLANVGTRVSSLVPSRAGSAPPAYATAKVRFAELLRTRERLVTAADYDVAARAFEPRVLRTAVTASVELGDDGVPRRVDAVAVHVRPEEFADAAGELPRLAAALERHLQSRAALGSLVRVHVRTEAPAAAAPARSPHPDADGRIASGRATWPR